MLMPFVADTTTQITAALAALREELAADRATNVGFPSTFDFDYAPLWPFFGFVLNNVGDPYAGSAFPAHTKAFEREVVDRVADLLRAPADDRWGYVTTGGTEGNEFGLHLARELYPDALVYFSEAAHYSVAKVAEKLRMPAVTVRAHHDGQMDYRDLRAVAQRHRDRAAVVVATIGTTMTEAVDDVRAIEAVLREVAIRRRHIHADAALSGLPLALLEPAGRAGFDLTDGAGSVAISGHKFLGCPFPSGVVVTRRSLRDRVARPIDYIGGVDATIGGSRSGHAPLLLWYALRRHGVDGLRERARVAREVAAYAVARLGEISWRAWRHPYAFTVVLDTPPRPVTDRWALATSEGRSHLVCMPGISRAQIDAFVTDLAEALAAPRVAARAADATTVADAIDVADGVGVSAPASVRAPTPVPA